jgi:hypothetical protein
MDEITCACGFVQTDDYRLADHLGEVFIPADDLAFDGQIHAEAARDGSRAAGQALACLCGYQAANGAALDAHLLKAFAPSGHAGLDGRPHGPTAEGSGVDAG